MTLDAADVGQAMTVVAANASRGAVSRRLAELGVRPGVRLRLLSRTSGGGALIALGDDRLAVSREILTSIEVTDHAPAHG